MPTAYASIAAQRTSDAMHQLLIYVCLLFTLPPHDQALASALERAELLKEQVDRAHLLSRDSDRDIVGACAAALLPLHSNRALQLVAQIMTSLVRMQQLSPVHGEQAQREHHLCSIQHDACADSVLMGHPKLHPTEQVTTCWQ